MATVSRSHEDPVAAVVQAPVRSRHQSGGVDDLRPVRWLLSRWPSREVLTFLGVGGAGYIVDVATFNALLSWSPLAGRDPSLARVLAVAVAMIVTYAGNRWLTWRSASRGERGREVALFVVFNVVGLGISVLCLVVSHDLLGLTGRWADNISANGVGLALATMFRFWSYRRFVFRAVRTRPPDSVGAHGGVQDGVRVHPPSSLR